ncbi:hypothetical protein [Actinomycetospora sp. TBRC 11914]|uniref:hypothetical protein n=1 Tax=Actinomycetospora sp. TBRC 11914 TaxID=2729387 RepID=UPI00145D4A82|nr:hypothetical protein [Actinomycetospora sp. TBRC 11914]NMO93925.1 hypothetical protein [Actinomycetospora sp. TBRC 11914]
MAYQRKDRSRYRKLKADFVRENGTIRDEYIAVRSQSGVYLTDQKGDILRWRHSYRIQAYYARALNPALDDAVRKTRFEESRWQPVLSGRSEEIVLTQLFSLIASLFRVQDLERGVAPTREQQTMIATTAADVLAYVPVLQRFAAGLARRATLQAYFFGMLVGVAVAATVIWWLSVPARLTLGTIPLSLVGVCAAAGGVGAVISVMVRVTNNENLNIDYERGRIIAFLVGVFRPLIGAVFGGILLIFLKSGLIAITIAPATIQDITLFYVAVGFLAGFSERWAQDTIVNSAPALRARTRSPDGEDGVPPHDAEAGHRGREGEDHSRSPGSTSSGS